MIDSADKKTLDLFESEANKVRGMDNAERGSGPEWQDSTVEAIRKLANEVPYLTSDCLWARGLTVPGESRALGPALKRAEKHGYILATMHFVNTLQASRHRAPVRVWRSCLLAPMPFEEGALVSRREGAKKTS